MADPSKIQESPCEVEKKTGTRTDPWWIARLKAFKAAGMGILHLMREPHASIHLGATVVVVILGLLFEIHKMEWLAIMLTVGLVWAAEALNTAIEKLADRVNPEHDPAIGKVKDLAAGGVLLASLAALVVGVIIFGAKLF